MGYRPVVDMLFCFVLSVFYYPILKVKTLLLVSIGSLRSDDGNVNGNATKTIGLISKTTILHVQKGTK